MTESNAPTPTIAPGLVGMAEQNPDVMALLQARPELIDSFNDNPEHFVWLCENYPDFYTLCYQDQYFPGCFEQYPTFVQTCYEQAEFYECWRSYPDFGNACYQQPDFYYCRQQHASFTQLCHTQPDFVAVCREYPQAAVICRQYPGVIDDISEDPSKVYEMRQDPSKIEDYAASTTPYDGDGVSYGGAMPPQPDSTAPYTGTPQMPPDATAPYGGMPQPDASTVPRLRCLPTWGRRPTAVQRRRETKGPTPKTPANSGSKTRARARCARCSGSRPRGTRSSWMGPW
jgi:hypothetical protein